MTGMGTDKQAVDRTRPKSLRLPTALLTAIDEQIADALERGFKLRASEIVAAGIVAYLEAAPAERSKLLQKVAVYEYGALDQPADAAAAQDASAATGAALAAPKRRRIHKAKRQGR